MTTIVGLKRIRYLTVEKGTRSAYRVTYHQRTLELHATKGWRKGPHQRSYYDLPRMPTPKEWRQGHAIEFERVNAKEAPMVERLKGIRP